MIGSGNDSKMSKYKIATVGDPTTGHGAFPPTKIATGSSLFKVNGKPVARIGDVCEPHTDGDSTHTPVISEGSKFVKIDGRPVAFTTCKVADGGCDDSHRIADGDDLFKISG